MTANRLTNPSPLKVFISYSHRDEDLKEELEVHLASLKREGTIAPWQDRDIEAGEEWDDKIREALEAAQIILLLITPRFLASRYCFDEETKRAMERHEAGTARVIPVIMKPADWETSHFSKLQVLPKDGKPCTRWDDLDEALVNVVSGIRRVVQSLSVKLDSMNEQASSAFNNNKVANSEMSSSSSEAQPANNSVEKRLALIRLLSQLPAPQFEMLVFALDIPSANIPSSTLPAGQRASELLNWARSPVGCGLDALESTLNEVINP